MGYRSSWVITGVALVGLGGQVWAQIPPTPSVPSVPAAPVPAAPAAGAPAAGAAPTRNLWSFLIPSASQKASLKQKCCNTGLGKLFSSMLSPMSLFTGGVISPPCPGPNVPDPNALNQPADSAEGAAARIKKEEADAKARAAAVRYLGTVPCRYYPEAEAALINSLRGDPNECVRIEAARALANGCCCTKKTIAALTRSVSGDEKDSHPAEHSECVKALAFIALQRCLASYTETPRQPEPPSPAPAAEPPAGGPAESGVRTAAYYRDIESTPGDYILAEARVVAARGLDISRATYRKLTGVPENLLDIAADVAGAEPRVMPVVSEQVAANGNEPPLSSAGPEPSRGGANLLDLWRAARHSGGAQRR